jgi:hypothetical protein
MIGLWLEQYEIVTVGLRRDFIPSTWHGFSMTFWDWATLLGTLGFFVTMMLIFLRFVPAIAIFEVRKDATPEVKPVTVHFAEGRIVGAFPCEQSLCVAVKRLREAEIALRAYTPYPVKELPALLGFKEYWLPWVILLGGLGGAAVGWGAQWYTSVVDYPLNIGGRALNSVAAFVPALYECTVLGAVVSGIVCFFWLNGMPHLSNPVFELPEMDRSTQDRFLLVVESHENDFHSIRNLMVGQDSRAPLEANT